MFIHTTVHFMHISNHISQKINHLTKDQSPIIPLVVVVYKHFLIEANSKSTSNNSGTPADIFTPLIIWPARFALWAISLYTFCCVPSEMTLLSTWKISKIKGDDQSSYRTRNTMQTFCPVQFNLILYNCGR